MITIRLLHPNPKAKSCDRHMLIDGFWVGGLVLLTDGTVSSQTVRDTHQEVGASAYLISY